MCSNVDLETTFTIVDGLLNYNQPSDLGIFPNYFLGSIAKVQTGEVFKEIANTRKLLQSLHQKFKNFIRKVCWMNPQHHASIVSVYTELFGQLAARRDAVPYTQNEVGLSVSIRGIRYRKWSIFTTNYDLVLEYFFRSEEIPIFLGFENNPKTSRMELDPNNFQINRLKLFKLHGSLSWHTFNDGSVTEYREKDPPESTFDGKNRVGELIVYPIQPKGTYMGPFIDMFFQLASKLRQCSEWLVIGYSFNDDAIRDMFISNSTQRKRLVYVHPRANEIYHKRLQDIKSPIFCIDSKFGTPGNVNAMVACLARSVEYAVNYKQIKTS